MPTLDAVGFQPAASVVSGDFDLQIFFSQMRDVNEGFKQLAGVEPLWQTIEKGC